MRAWLLRVRRHSWLVGLGAGAAGLGFSSRAIAAAAAPVGAHSGHPHQHQHPSPCAQQDPPAPTAPPRHGAATAEPADANTDAGAAPTPTPPPADMAHAVTVFSIPNCPHCARAKAYLTSAGVAYSEIDIAGYPECRKGMLQLSGKFSVPQVFIGNTLIGGADDTTALAKDELKRRADASAPPSDKRLHRPTHAPQTPPEPSPRKDASITIGETVVGYVDATRKLRGEAKTHDALPEKSWVAIVAAAWKVPDVAAEKAVMEMVSKKLLCDVPKGNGKLKAYCDLDANKTALNRFRPWDDRLDDPATLIRALKKKIDALKGKCRDAGTGLVDYHKMTQDDAWEEFLDAASELTRVDMQKMNDTARTAFVINVYNTFIPVAFAARGVPQSDLARYRFFDRVYVDVGGELYSFNDLENGVLRGNRKAPYHMSPQFKGQDSRVRLRVANPDPRIHFALNCGAKSCPPVKFFTADALDEELGIVTAAFFESNLEVKPDALKVTQIIQWYAEDFGGAKATFLVPFLQKYLTGTRQEELKVVSTDLAKVKLSYFAYDWTTDADLRNIVHYDDPCCKCAIL